MAIKNNLPQTSIRIDVSYSRWGFCMAFTTTQIMI